MTNERFGFVAFRSRQQLAAYESLLKKQGISCKLINTPMEIGAGCGFSIKFSMDDLRTAISTSERRTFTALIGFYYTDIINGTMEYKPITPAMLSNK